MSNVAINIMKLRPDAIIPAYQTAGSAAMDLHAAISESITIHSLERMVIPSGFAMALPEGYEAQIRPRSGMALKHGIALANGVATIDSDYRGEIGIIIINLSKESFTVEPGMRIAQMIISRYDVAQWHEVDTLEPTERSTGGYGSTGQ